MSVREVRASIGQRLLWQMDHHRGANGALNCPIFLRLRGPAHVGELEAAIDRLGRRHESLRTTFAGRGPRLTQLIHDVPERMPIAEVDLSGEDDVAEALERAMAAEARTPVDPCEWPLRATLWRLSDDEHVLCLNMHHLVTDGWSCAVLASELGRLYAAPGNGALPEVAWQYEQWSEWQQRLLEGETLRGLRDYWRRRLAGATLPALPRAAVRADPAERTTRVERASLEAPVVARLERLAREGRTGLFAVVLAVLYLLLHRETGQSDVAVGSIFANRSRPELRHTVGFLSNMVVLRNRLERPSFADVLRSVSETIVGALAHQDLPYQMLPLDTMDPGSGRPDSVVFQLFAGPMGRTETARGRIEPVLVVPDGIGSRWDFELSLLPSADGMTVMLCYAEDLFEPEWARRFLDGYVSLATSV
ncbi:MAG TPA: condensation domain-containing protein [Gaiellaceae bacterium]|nr:condensation domain-containing protein [Gaiellaceae bacterium]